MSQNLQGSAVPLPRPAGPELRITVLGPLAVSLDGVDVAIAGRRERMVLASLTAARPAPVAPERLVDDLWAGRPPTTALTALQVCVSRLRSALEPGRQPRTPSRLLVTTPVGYELRPPAGAVDADRFASAVDDAQAAAAGGDPARALSLLDSALLLWKGAAYADTADLPGPREEAGRLAELRLAAAELRLDALLALRRHAQVVLDAERLTREHPFRERLAELWALALYRGGRQADALAVLAANRRRLADELGVDPCPMVRELERDILRQAPQLDVDPGMSAAAVGTAATTGTDADSDTQVDTDTESDPESDPETDANADTAPGTEAGTETDAEPGTETDADPESEASREDSQPDAAPAPEAAATADSLPAAPTPTPTTDNRPLPNPPSRSPSAPSPDERAARGTRNSPPRNPPTHANPTAPAAFSPPDERDPTTHANRAAPNTSFLPHIGRQPQRDALAQAVADTRAGHGALVVISGEPGIGKTRLLGELERLAAEGGVRMLRGRCPETDAAPAFWPWQAVLRGIGAETHTDTPTALDPPTPADPLGFAPASAPLRVYESVTRAVAADAAVNGPVAVVLDDIHWADPSSLHLLGYAAEMLAGHPVLVAVTLRDNHPRADSALDACLATLARLHPVRLRLSGLDPAEIGELLRQSVRTDIDCATANLIHARADGNPFYARELARLLGRDADFDLHSSAIPDGVRDVVRRRVGLIPETTRTLLRLASVVGRDVDVDLLGAVSGTPVDDLVDACDAAVAHGLLEETGLARYRFTHALVRETLYDDLGAGRRGRMHGDIGAVLEAWLPEHPELLDSVAYHLAFGSALRPALVGSAARHGIAAARQAGLQYAYDDACARWERTADLVAGRRGVDPRVRFDVMHGLGVARRRVGDLAGAKRALGEAIRLGRELGDTELVALAAISIGGTELWNWREYAEVDHEVIAVLEQCRTELPPGALRCRATASLAVELVFTWDAGRSDVLSAEAVAEARESGDPETLAYALSCRYLATWFPGTAPARLAATEELTDLAAASGHADVELAARFFRGIVLLELGRVAESDEQRAACEALVVRLRRSSSAIQMQWWNFLRMHMAGRTADLAAMLPDAVRRHRATTLVGHAECEGNALSQVAEMEGNLAAALPRLIELVKGSPYPVFHAQVARAALLTGRPDLAAHHLPPASPPGFAGSWLSLATDCLRVEVLAGLGRVDEVRVAMDRIRPHADGLVIYGSIACLGSVRYFLGLGAAACGDRAEAIRELGAAVTANAAWGAAPWQDRSERRLAELTEDPRG